MFFLFFSVFVCFFFCVFLFFSVFFCFFCVFCFFLCFFVFFCVFLFLYVFVCFFLFFFIFQPWAIRPLEIVTLLGGTEIDIEDHCSTSTEIGKQGRIKKDQKKISKKY